MPLVALTLSRRSLRVLRQVLVYGNASLSLLLMPFLLSLGSALAEGAFFGLLLPLLSLFLESHPQIGTSLPIFNSVRLPMPEWVSTSLLRAQLFVLSLALGVALLKIVCDLLSVISLTSQINRFVANLRQRIFERMMNLGKAFFDENPSGELVSLQVQATGEIASVIPQMRVILLVGAYLGVYLYVLLSISWGLTLISFAMFPVMYFAAHRINHSIANLSRERTAAHISACQRLIELLQALPLIKAFCTEKLERDRFREVNADLGRFDNGIEKRSAANMAIQETLTISFLMGLLFATSLLISRGHLAPGAQYFLFFFLLRRISVLFGQLTGALSLLNRANAPIDKVLRFFDDGDKPFVQDGKQEFQGLAKGIEFRGLSFRYKDLPVLREIHMEIPRGRTTALVGPTGAGKSTVLSLLQRMYECPAGTLFVDGIDIRDLRLDSLRKHIAVVSQEIFLFNDTIRANLLYGINRDVRPDELKRAIDRSSLNRWISSLPHGLDTSIGDRGIKLSGGEKQRLSIARAILHDGDIVLMDEATSHLDTETERLIQESFEQLFGRKTTVVIAHRISTIMRADQVVFLEDGKISEHGSVRELLDRKARFYRYYQLQSISHEAQVA